MELKNICALPSLVGMPRDTIGEMLRYMDGDMIFLLMQLCKPLKETIIQTMQNQPSFVIQNRHQLMSDEAYVCFMKLEIKMNVIIHRCHYSYGFVTKRNGKIDSINGQPAIENDWCKTWYKYGLEHGEGNRPSEISDEEGGKVMVWKKKGKITRDRFPAEITKEEIRYYQNNKLHRGDGMPAVIRVNGDKLWFLHGVLKHVEIGGKDANYDIMTLYVMALGEFEYMMMSTRDFLALRFARR